MELARGGVRHSKQSFRHRLPGLLRLTVAALCCTRVDGRSGALPRVAAWAALSFGALLELDHAHEGIVDSSGHGRGETLCERVCTLGRPHLRFHPCLRLPGATCLPLPSLRARPSAAFVAPSSNSTRLRAAAAPSLFTQAVNAFDEANAKRRSKIATMRHFADTRKLNGPIKRRLLAYIDAEWSMTDGIDATKFIKSSFPSGAPLAPRKRTSKCARTYDRSERVGMECATDLILRHVCGTRRRRVAKADSQRVDLPHAPGLDRARAVVPQGEPGVHHSDPLRDGPAGARSTRPLSLHDAATPTLTAHDARCDGVSFGAWP